MAAQESEEIFNIDGKENNLLTTVVDEFEETFTKTKEINSKEIVIALGVLLAVAIICFFLKNYLSKMLVASFKKSPRTAEMAGWSLFSILTLAAFVTILGILNATKFMTLPYLIPICLAMIAAIISFIIALLSKR